MSDVGVDSAGDVGAFVVAAVLALGLALLLALAVYGFSRDAAR